ncbi:MAG: hypothetical protein NVS1B10_06210 [Candidatus Saccharimonadales bacterium]
MSNTFVPIYILRSQCQAHGLDTMRTFTLKGNESPDEAFKQMERWVKQRWPKEHDCTHPIHFTRSVEKEYRYHTKKKKAVKI